MTIRDELIASRDGGGPGVMMLTTDEGVQYVGLDANDNVIELDPAEVYYGGETGLRHAATEGE